MNKNILFISIVGCLFFSCTKPNDPDTSPGKVLMLQVDYLTNTFEGAKEISYSAAPSTFTLSNEYIAPSDAGSIKIKYLELNEILFDGTIIWAGRGDIKLPANISPANQFNSVTTADIVYPAAGFQNVFNPHDNIFDYAPVWLAVQKLVKVREYLKANPNTSVKLFLYTRSVGAGDPADADWIIFLKS
jgi:hypothetical protein